MPEVCVPNNHCGTQAPGWLNGKHPSAADGIVSRQVCYGWVGCCNWANYIDVRNCTGFYVYRLQPSPACNLGYCGNGVPGASRFSLSLNTKLYLYFICILENVVLTRGYCKAGIY